MIEKSLFYGGKSLYLLFNIIKNYNMCKKTWAYFNTKFKNKLLRKTNLILEINFKLSFVKFEQI